jgi:hypothetical protein
MTNPVSPARSDPAKYDYANPTRNCDIVMKGGITSGVVYPFAVCEIAQTYRFKNVGGTSAGAIAAAAAAAAEYGRFKGGFERLAALPQWLGSGSNLLDVFQPQSGTRGLYRLFLAPIGHPKGRWRRLVVALLRNFAPWFVLGATPGVLALIGALSLGDGFGRGLWVGLSAVLLVLGAVGVGLYGVYWTLTHRLAANGFGLCAGMGLRAGEAEADRKETGDQAKGAGVPPLSEWLAATIDRLAGNDPQTASPLTFGDLWRGPDGIGVPPGDQSGGPFLNLQMMTTSLTLGRPYRLPFDAGTWFFDPREFRKRFPDRVVKWMEDHSRALPRQPEKRRRELVLRRVLSPLVPMPEADHLPVVVATRMSLSFPLLISAVPLHAVDWSLKANVDAARAWAHWRKQNEDILERLVADDAAWEAVQKPSVRPVAEASWFSDGGITSNFPVHFFDAPIPRWPTFAINLREYPRTRKPKCDECEEGQSPCDQGQSVWTPASNRGGILEGWRAGLEAGPGLKPLIAFGHSIIDTMQNWTDNTQLVVPGYRDRVAHVFRTHEEGGINLNMPACRITALTERGRIAGERLATRFSLTPPPGEVLTWANHRWVRYRTSMALVQDLLYRFRRAWKELAVPGDGLYPAKGDLSYDDLLALDPKGAPGYPFDGQHPFAVAQTANLLDLSAALDTGGDFARDAPRPRPELRVRPRA